MDEPAAKRSRLSVEEVLLDMEDDDDEPMFPGSDDEFEDLVCDEKRRDDEWGVSEKTKTTPSQMQVALHSLH